MAQQTLEEVLRTTRWLPLRCAGVRQYAAVQTQKRKKGLKNMKFNFLQKQTSRREMLRDSATLAGSAFLASATLLRVGYAQQAPSAADLLASFRAQFNAVPMETRKLADNVTN